jgi:D-galactose 1-dehydrogenase
MRPHRIGIVGLGKIAQDQHLPVIAADPIFELLAVSTRSTPPPAVGVPVFGDYREMLALDDLDAVAICTPPRARHAIARDALLAGKHVMLEKPPAATLSEIADLRALAQDHGRTLFATWHSRHNRAVDKARSHLTGETVRRLRVTWKEDVRRWHPGQTWIWEEGGFGVFDPGINALSILTTILPEPIFIRGAELQIPANKQAPIAVSLRFGTTRTEADLEAEFDFRQTGPQTWDILIETGTGRRLKLIEGGTKLELDGQLETEAPWREYRGVYGRFDELLKEGLSDVDDSPLRLVADAFLVGRRVTVEPFDE